VLKIEAGLAKVGRQKEVGFDSQNYPQKLWTKCVVV
jgi:hypothetical protein